MYVRLYVVVYTVYLRLRLTASVCMCVFWCVYVCVTVFMYRRVRVCLSLLCTNVCMCAGFHVCLLAYVDMREYNVHAYAVHLCMYASVRILMCVRVCKHFFLVRVYVLVHVGEFMCMCKCTLGYVGV